MDKTKKQGNGKRKEISYTVSIKTPPTHPMGYNNLAFTENKKTCTEHCKNIPKSVTKIMENNAPI